MSAKTLTGQRGEILNSGAKALISAVTGEGIDELFEVIDEKLSEKFLEEKIKIPCHNGKAIAWAYAKSKVLNEEQNDEIMEMTILISEKDFGKLKKMMN